MLPQETLLALVPGMGRSEDQKQLGLRPVTLAHIVALDFFRIDIDKPIARRQALLAAWLLTLDSAGVQQALSAEVSTKRTFTAWQKRVKLSPAHVINTVATALKEAFTTIVEHQKPQGTTENLVEQGLGWPLHFAEWYAAEYHTSIETALDVPLVRLFALEAAARRRNNIPFGGPDYYERHQIQEMKKLRQELHKRKEQNHG